jgi:PIN domain nuclease of toxin-antitoxin system
VRLLLDTHAMYWYAVGDPQLSPNAQLLIQDATNEVLISPASYWEIAIKVSIGKWIMHRPYEEFIDACLNVYGFHVLPIEPKHTNGGKGKRAIVVFRKNHAGTIHFAQPGSFRSGMVS